jgi:hypothetical protein
VTFKVWDYVSSISLSKEKLEVTKDYNPFMVNRALSFFTDTIFYANEMNIWWRNIDNEMQFDYLRNSIRPKHRRSGKWPKQQANEDLDTVMKYYGYGRREAADALTVMDSKHVEMLKDELERRSS